MKISSEEKSPDSISEHVAGFFARGGALEKACASTPFPFEIRPQQQAMAEAVAEAFIGSEHLAVEAGTGVGKTYAYLVPLILTTLQNERPAAVSTHTINLQEQLMFKDVPFLLENMGVDFKVVLCKGRGNYLCLRRLEAANRMSGDLFNKNGEKELARLRRWADETQDGSLSGFSEHTTPPAPDIWRQVCSEYDNCLGRKCGHYVRCFLMRARNAAFEADLLILNHHLLFSDLALRRDQAPSECSPLRHSATQRRVAQARGKGVLPECGALVIDEAHCLEEIASEHLGLRFSQGGLNHWLRRLYVPASGKGLLAALKEYELADEAARLWESGEHFFREVSAFAVLDGKTGNKRIIEERLNFETMPGEQIAAFVRRLEALRETTEDEELKTELKSVALRGDELRRTLEWFVKDKEPDFIYWIERDNGARGRLALVSAPVAVAPVLKNLLFDSFSPVVLTSATLSVGGSLGFFRKRVGAEKCRELVVNSPFNYSRQMKVFIAADMPDPKDEKFPEAVAGAVAHFVKKTGGRAFVLFTNAELMRQVAGRLENFFAEEGVLALVQGEGLPKHVMLKKFKAAHNPSEMQNAECSMQKKDSPEKSQIATSATLSPSDPLPATGDGKNPKSAHRLVRRSSWSEGGSHEPCEGEGGSKISRAAVLFGLDSFWMGVDVQGEALSNVIIVRLPFAVPDEPLVKARLDRITAEGKDAFREYTLPQAILKFRQGIGRLIRTATDEGMIVILDSRIITRWYGKFFLQAIPECVVEEAHIRGQT